MLSTKSELKEDVREMTGYTSTLALSHDGLDTAYRNAKRHIRVKKAIGPDYNWFDPEVPEAQEALFWFTCLFTKIQVGELDSQEIQVGAVDTKSLLAKDNDEVTTWYRNAMASLQSLKSSNIIRASAPSRSGRQYEADGFVEQQSGGTEADTDTDV
jgi:hypothetical protein